MVVCCLANLAVGQVNGAIQTTDSTGTIVNFNVNPPLSCDAVYLTGGPQNTNDFGLTPGIYYFRVTDPSGANVLSLDAGSATLTVAVVGGKGVITGYNTGSSTYDHSLGSTTDPSSGETTVLLWPFSKTPNAGGVYKAWISTDPTFTNSTTKTDNFKCTYPTPPGCSDPDYAAEHPEECGQQPPSANIVGTKFYDANTDGAQDNGEVGIQDWLITINPAAQGGTTCNLTDSNGGYLFSVDPNSGDYTIAEGTPLQLNWFHTTATSGIATAGTDTIQGPVFGNVCVGTGGGLTMGYWSNKNGQNSMGCGKPLTTCASELAFLTSLNLRNANGSNFDPTTYAQYDTWLLNATATNMAYMLSAQLSAMELNVLNKFVQGGTLVHAGTAPANCSVPGLNSNGFISVSDLMNDANSASNFSLAAYGNTTAAGDARSCQEFMKTALDNANNNKTFVQPTACTHTFDTSACTF